MPKILVLHGAGMNMRGKVQIETFGPLTLPEYDTRIHGYAAELGLEAETFHSNIEGEVINKLYDAYERKIDGAIFNTAGYGRGYPALVAAMTHMNFPIIEVHMSNPLRRGPASETSVACQGVVAGFGIQGYYLALHGLRELIAAKKK